MKIRQILAKECIKANLQATNKEGVLAELAALLAEANPHLSRDKIIEVLMEREKLGSTGIGNGVAIPHGKLSGIDQIVTAFGRSLEGISFDS